MHVIKILGCYILNHGYGVYEWCDSNVKRWIEKQTDRYKAKSLRRQDSGVIFTMNKCLEKYQKICRLTDKSQDK